MRKKILKQIQNHQITPAEGYRLLYQPKDRRGNFVSMRIHIKSAKFVGYLVNAFFIIPWPIGIVKLILFKVMKKKDLKLDRKTIDDLLGASRFSSVKIENEEVNIKLFII